MNQRRTSSRVPRARPRSGLRDQRPIDQTPRSRMACIDDQGRSTAPCSPALPVATAAQATRTLPVHPPLRELWSRDQGPTNRSDLALSSMRRRRSRRHSRGRAPWSPGLSGLSWGSLHRVHRQRPDPRRFDRCFSRRRRRLGNDQLDDGEGRGARSCHLCRPVRRKRHFHCDDLP